ncbi:hypothetical protein SteCoe_34143 [Stentor coeruleus]|uniref:FHA domain-containing protein n=1 Tax=Stentor coeruleus TaxID=5963 RepID=A0A1R2AVD2_9CILI|nr:hypothetical protein SteCoe_34143 [Stentor coeruleus]
MNQSKTTVYQKTTASIPESVLQAQSEFKKLQIYTIGLTPQRSGRIEYFFEHEINWLTYCINYKNEISNYLQNKFHEFINILDEWKKKESESGGKNQGMLESIDQKFGAIRRGVLAVLLCRKGYTFEDYERVADYMLSAYPRDHFDTLILKGKKDFFQAHIWTKNSSTMNWNDFITNLNNDFFLMFENGINIIFQKEIKKHLNIGETVEYSILDQIFSYIIGSSSLFRKVVNRNYLYNCINEALDKEGAIYDRLPVFQDSRKSAKIILTHSPIPDLNGRTYEISNFGVENSERFLRDHIVTFGKDSNEEFSNDITLPNMNDVDSIFAFIFINANGFNLIDISSKGSVRIKLHPNKRIELEPGMIIIIGTNHQFSVRIKLHPNKRIELEPGMIIIIGTNHQFTVNSLGLIFLDGFNQHHLCIQPSQDDKTTNKMKVQSLEGNDKIYIGKDKSCHMRVDYPDVSDQHAYFEKINGKWFLRDNYSERGTFYKLKKMKNITKQKPSASFSLKNNRVFMVQRFIFIFLSNEREYTDEEIRKRDMEIDLDKDF